MFRETRQHRSQTPKDKQNIEMECSFSNAKKTRYPKICKLYLTRQASRSTILIPYKTEGMEKFDTENQNIVPVKK